MQSNNSAPFPLQAKFDTLGSNHQRSLEELKATLSSDPATAAGQEQDVQELRATLEALKMEHQLEMENLKTKHKIEAAILTKEHEDLCGRLQDLKDQGRAEVETRSSKQALEEAADKLQKAEQRQAELRERLDLSEKKMTDYQALQKAQAESQEEIHKLEEKLRVTANQLQAIQADRYTSHDANVRRDECQIRTPIRCQCFTLLTLDPFFR